MKYQRNRYNTGNKRNYYNYTSVAYDYEPEYSTSRHINRRIKKIKKDKYVEAEKGIRFFSLKFIATLVIISTFVISIIFIEALTIQKKFDIEDLNITLKEIKENNKYLETELAKNLDLEYVEYIATSELGMQKPANHQIVHIDVPKESYSQKGKVEKKDTFLSKITSWINK